MMRWNLIRRRLQTLLLWRPRRSRLQRSPVHTQLRRPRSAPKKSGSVVRSVPPALRCPECVHIYLFLLSNSNARPETSRASWRSSERTWEF